MNKTPSVQFSVKIPCPRCHKRTYKGNDALRNQHWFTISCPSCDYTYSVKIYTSAFFINEEAKQ